MSALVLVAELTTLLLLHSVDGREIDVNPAEITSLSEARASGDPKKQFTDNVRCVIFLTDGRYLTVDEECHQIRGMIRGMLATLNKCEDKHDEQH
jgi:hypothetical protein